MVQPINSAENGFLTANGRKRGDGGLRLIGVGAKVLEKMGSSLSLDDGSIYDQGIYRPTILMPIINIFEKVF